MYTKTKYSFKDMLLWTRRELCIFFFIALIPTVLFETFELRWLQLPWTPIALVGTAVAFLIGFQSNAAYGRTWEARKIWGGVVNSSRSLGLMINDLITNEHAAEPVTPGELMEHRATLTRRHIAWITALRYAMREKRPWEVFAEHPTNKEWYDNLCIPERDTPLEVELKRLLPGSELQFVMQKTNKAVAILTLQSRHLRDLKEIGLIWEFSFLEFENVLRELLAMQGKSERIKNFPYPRQYATLSYDTVRVFILLLPLGVIPEFARLGEQFSESFPSIGAYFVWLAIPFAMSLSWVFHTMQRIGTVGENPFEGSANDVPISTISRGIEIDMREMLGEAAENVPKPLPSLRNVQM